MQLVRLVIVVVLSLMLMTDWSEARIFGPGCGRRCRRAGSDGGRRYTSPATGIKYCLCSGPTRFLPRHRRDVAENWVQDRLSLPHQ